MIFQILEKVKLRNDTKKYFDKSVSFNNYNVYIGVIQQYFSVLVTPNLYNITDIEFNNEIEIIKLYNSNQTFNQERLEKSFELLEKNIDKSLELLGPNIYIKSPINLDFIDWLKSETIVFNETIDTYTKISLPYINSILDKNTKWINELLFNNSEESIVLMRNSDYVICKDIVWTNNDIDKFYLLAIPIKKLKTIRDLRQSDITLLKNIKTKAIEIAESYGVSKDKLYMFFHYHPSYYQLHLHISLIDHPDLETKYLRHYFIDDIIEKLELDSEYWANTTLKFESLTGTKLSKLLNDYKVN